MSLTTSALWPYVVLILVGFLPNEIWRWLGFALARGIDEGSEILVWVRAVATAVLAAVISKLIFFAPGATASTVVNCAQGTGDQCLLARIPTAAPAAATTTP